MRDQATKEESVLKAASSLPGAVGEETPAEKGRAPGEQASPAQLAASSHASGEPPGCSLLVPRGRAGTCGCLGVGRARGAPGSQPGL